MGITDTKKSLTKRNLCAFGFCLCLAGLGTVGVIYWNTKSSSQQTVVNSEVGASQNASNRDPPIAGQLNTSIPKSREERRIKLDEFIKQVTDNKYAYKMHIHKENDILSPQYLLEHAFESAVLEQPRFLETLHDIQELRMIKESDPVKAKTEEFKAKLLQKENQYKVEYEALFTKFNRPLDTNSKHIRSNNVNYYLALDDVRKQLRIVNDLGDKPGEVQMKAKQELDSKIENALQRHPFFEMTYARLSIHSNVFTKYFKAHRGIDNETDLKLKELLKQKDTAKMIHQKIAIFAKIDLNEWVDNCKKDPSEENYY